MGQRRIKQLKKLYRIQSPEITQITQERVIDLKKKGKVKIVKYGAKFGTFKQVVKQYKKTPKNAKAKLHLMIEEELKQKQENNDIGQNILDKK